MKIVQVGKVEVELNAAQVVNGKKCGMTLLEIAECVLDGHQEAALDRASYAHMSQEERDAHDNK